MAKLGESELQYRTLAENSSDLVVRMLAERMVEIDTRGTSIPAVEQTAVSRTTQISGAGILAVRRGASTSRSWNCGARLRVGWQRSKPSPEVASMR